MKKLIVILMSGALMSAPTAASAASSVVPGTTGYCYDANGQQTTCPRYEGRSQALGGADGLDPLWVGAGLILLGGGVAAAITLSNNNNTNTGFIPFVAPVATSP
jgi:hypothetical protein